MRSIDKFTPTTPDAEKQTVALRSPEGLVTDRLDGVLLEGQLQTRDDALVITSDEDPFEGYLHFSLINKASSCVDRLSLGLPYRSGTFRRHSEGPGEAITFSFFADEVWQLEVLTQPRFVARLGVGPARYPGGFLRRHRLVLTKRRA